MLVGAGIATVWHLLEHGALALKASGHHSSHGKSSHGKGKHVAGFDNSINHGEGVGVGIGLPDFDHSLEKAATHGKRTDSIHSG